MGRLIKHRSSVDPLSTYFYGATKRLIDNTYQASGAFHAPAVGVDSPFALLRKQNSFAPVNDIAGQTRNWSFLTGFSASVYYYKLVKSGTTYTLTITSDSGLSTTVASGSISVGTGRIYFTGSGCTGSVDIGYTSGIASGTLALKGTDLWQADCGAILAADTPYQFEVYDGLKTWGTFTDYAKGDICIATGSNNGQTSSLIRCILDVTATPVGSNNGLVDITNPSGTTFRYTEASGSIGANMAIGNAVAITGTGFAAGNNGTFIVTNRAATWFEVTNAAGVVESGKTKGTGTIIVSALNPFANGDPTHWVETTILDDAVQAHLVATNEFIERSNDNTLLSILNTIQRKARVGESTVAEFATDPAVKVICDFINEIIDDINLSYRLDMCQTSGTVRLIKDANRVIVAPQSNPSTSSLLDISYLTTQLEPRTESQLNMLELTATGAAAAPRLYATNQANGSLNIRVYPKADQDYTLNYNAMIQLPRLVLPGDTCPIAADVIVFGALAKLLEYNGEDITSAANQYGAKIALHSVDTDTTFQGFSPWRR